MEETNQNQATSEPAIRTLHDWVDAHREEMVTALQGVLRIPSKKDSPADRAPYGIPVRQALDYTLALAGQLGFRTKDVDGFAGHAEFGDGPEMIAAMGHLDVVPEGDGWQHPPYGAEIDNGYLYARGASDDKGPTYAVLFAAKALLDSGLPLRRRVRIIFGCDEESGFGCVKHYWETAGEERPVLAFTPDASFPLIYAEKGIATLLLSRAVEGRTPPSGLRAAAFQGGLRPNMVPDSASVELVGEKADLYDAMVVLGRHWDRNITLETREDRIIVRAAGKPAHGSAPANGDNAVVRLARALLGLPLPQDRPWLEWISRSSDPVGAGLGIQGQDDVAGPLTCNLGIAELRDGVARLTYNIRYPVTWTFATLLDRARPVAEKAGWSLEVEDHNPPLHVPLDEEPVKTLLRVYREETGDTESQPRTMGGGTYARATPRAVAFGPGFPGGKDGPAHEPDERFAIESYLKAAKIYAHALYELAK